MLKTEPTNFGPNIECCRYLPFWHLPLLKSQFLPVNTTATFPTSAKVS